MRKPLYKSLLVFFTVLAFPVVALAVTYSSDLTTSGQAISGGDSGGNAKGNAFDDSNATLWVSSANAANCSVTPAWIGQDFGSGITEDIRRFSLKQSSGRTVTSVVIQYSDNGSSYSTAEVVAVVSDSVVHTYDIGEYGGHRYWRLNCNATPALNWGIDEAEMFKILSDTPTPTSTPANTLTPTATFTPTITNTPDYFQIATLSTLAANYPVVVKPQASFGEIALFAMGGVIASLSLIARVIKLVWDRNVGVSR